VHYAPSPCFCGKKIMQSTWRPDDATDYPRNLSSGIDVNCTFLFLEKPKKSRKSNWPGSPHARDGRCSRHPSHSAADLRRPPHGYVQRCVNKAKEGDNLPPSLACVIGNVSLAALRATYAANSNSREWMRFLFERPEQ